jgi:hypothetical protein
MGCQIAMYRPMKATELSPADPHTVHISSLSTKFYETGRSLIICLLLSGSGVAQAVSVAELNESPLNISAVAASPASPGRENPGAVAATPVVANTLPEAPSHHRFWDGKNRALFVAVAALDAADFVVTRANLQNGGKELNPVTRIFSGSTAGLAANFVGETAGVIGLSYYFHKTNHHRLERIAPMLNLSASSFAVVYDLSHR